MTGDPQQIRATFETWIKRRSDGTQIADLPGKFEVTIQPILAGGKYRLAAFIGTVRFSPETFAESKLEECKDWVRKQFRKQITGWQDAK